MNQWKTHTRPINIEELEELKLKIIVTVRKKGNYLESIIIK